MYGFEVVYLKVCVLTIAWSLKCCEENYVFSPQSLVSNKKTSKNPAADTQGRQFFFSQCLFTTHSSKNCFRSPEAFWQRQKTFELVNKDPGPGPGNKKFFAFGWDIDSRYDTLWWQRCLVDGGNSAFAQIFFKDAFVFCFDFFLCDVKRCPRRFFRLRVGS